MIVIRKYPALLIHKSKHCDAYYLVRDKEEYFSVLFSLFTDVFRLQEVDYGFYRDVEVNLFNQEDFKKHPWKKMESIKDLSSFYFEAYELALKGEQHEIIKHLDDEKYLKPDVWRSACISIMFKYFGDEIAVEFFDNIQ